MIEAMYTEFTRITVNSTRRAKYLARLTVFERLGKYGCAIDSTLVHHQVEVLLLGLEELVCEEVIWSV